MSRVIHELPQGGEDWHAHRARHFNASEAAAAIGISPYLTRTALLDAKKAGVEPAISDALQFIFDQGHRFEKETRPWAEAMLGTELYPVTISFEVDGLPLSASFDGLTVDENTVFEHKLMSQELRDSLTAGKIPDHYKPQLEQQLIVSGAQRCLFVASRGPDDVQFAWYESSKEWRDRVIFAWKQFAKDLAAHEAVAEAPRVVGATIDALPALLVRLRGEVVESNLEAYEKFALARIESVSTELATDQDFADAEKQVKFFDEAEKELGRVKSQALESTASIAELFRTIDTLQAAMRDKRLTLNSMVESEKKRIRLQIQGDAEKAYTAHLQTIRTRLVRATPLPLAAPSFGLAMKNKRTLASLHDAVDTLLAQSKIAADEMADRIEVNVAALADRATVDEIALAFRDLDTLTPKATEDFLAIAESRLLAHRQQVTNERERIERETREVVERERAAATVECEPDAPVVAIATTHKSGGMPEALRGWRLARGTAHVAAQFDVVDVALIPRRFFVIDTAGINVALADGEQIPGVRAHSLETTS